MRPNLVAMSAVAAFAFTTMAASAMPAGSSELPANNGSAATEAARGWKTDQRVRSGIDAIRGAIDAVRSTPPDAAQLESLGHRIESRVSLLLALCTDRTAAERHLRMLLAEMADGTDLMRHAAKVEARRMGLLKVVQALNLYGVLFQHPGWRALDETIDLPAP
ncbi:hypothetical protein [Azoarcus sp. KH32C]|uniref:hypothetical protein n=1 Tax=Azoarcus sp. KH32C TaxID=748247 RepID=UPI0002386203|nr:hypothetical protein [Azoarcus sp. KH32C]BAL22451.1 hypothetical protein AZKH_0104 [Azoarcus sp. KH32C]